MIQRAYSRDLRQGPQKPDPGAMVDLTHPLAPRVGHWAFAEGTGRMVQNAVPLASQGLGANVQGGIINGATWRQGHQLYGPAVKFTGVSGDYVDNGGRAAFRIPGDLTIVVGYSALDNYTSTQHLVTFGSSTGNLLSYALEFGRTDNKFSFLQNTATIALTGSASVADNVRRHIALTRRGIAPAVTLRLFIDGRLDATATSTVAPDNPDGVAILAFGRLGSAAVLPLTGFLDRVTIWNRTLTPDEVLADYLDEAAFLLPAAPRRLVNTVAGGGKPWLYYAQQRQGAM